MDLIEQQQKQEASQALTQKSVDAYTDFLNSMFSYYRGNLDQAQRGTRDTQAAEGDPREEAWDESAHQRGTGGRFT